MQCSLFSETAYRRGSGSDHCIAGRETATEADIENIRRVYGYDRPMLMQHGDWALQGDFGQSHYLRNPGADVICGPNLA